MTRHTLTENFDNRDVALAKGELVIILDNERSGERVGLVGKEACLDRVGGYYHVMVKTRHGRKVRVPRHSLSKEVVVFDCQLCATPSFNSYREYVDHMIEKHLRNQLLKGLDMTKKQPNCPFPSCHGMTWPVVDNLLFHYASHHNVLEKVLMYECEIAAKELRVNLREKEGIIETLVKEIGDHKEATNKNTEDQILGDKVQEDKEVKSVIVQMQSEIDKLIKKVEAKNNVIKSLKEDLYEAKESFKNCEKKYEEVVKYNVKIQSQLRNTKDDKSKSTEDKASPSTSGSKAQVELDQKVCDENNVSSSAENNAYVPNYEINDLRGKVEKLTNQNVAWQSQNDSLQLEIENMHMQNENLKNIIEIGKSTVETAKKISQDLSEENKLLKQKERDNLQLMQRSEGELKKVKLENQSLVGKCKELQDKVNVYINDYSKLQESFNLKSAEVGNLYTQITAKAKDDRKIDDKNPKSISGIKLFKDDTRSKLIKCRENCRTLEESKKSLENDKKALILENRNAANEIKTLKNHLSSNRAIVVEKAVAKDEVNNLKSELTSKCVEIEKSSIKLKKLSTELNCVLGELKAAKDSKMLMEKELLVIKDKMNGLKADELGTKSTFKEEEFTTLKSENETLKAAKRELGDRLEFYISQCSMFEKNDAQLQEEISLLQLSIKNSTIENSDEVANLRDAVQNLENSVVFYKDQEGVLIDENEKLKAEVSNLKSQQVVNINEDFLAKYNLKCDLVEELIKKHEKIAAQLRRKDWEIENYQKKLDSAFEAELLKKIPQSFTGGGGTSIAPRSPELALDLCTREVSRPNTEDARVMSQEVVAGPSVVVATSSNPTLTESSPGCNSHEASPPPMLNDSNPISLNENMDASFDSTSTCPSEAANIASASNPRRKRSVSVGHVLPPKKIPYVRLEDD